MRLDCSSTDLQINLESLVVDFCLKGDKMKFLCDNQGGLEETRSVLNETRPTAGVVEEKQDGRIESVAEFNSAPAPEAALTSLLVRPPLPHLCSLRVWNKRGVRSLNQTLLTDEMSVSQTGVITHQVFKLCWQAAIVRFFHVHNFSVGAEDIKLPCPKKVKGLSFRNPALTRPETTHTWCFWSLTLELKPRLQIPWKIRLNQ